MRDAFGYLDDRDNFVFYSYSYRETQIYCTKNGVNKLHEAMRSFKSGVFHIVSVYEKKGSKWLNTSGQIRK